MSEKTNKAAEKVMMVLQKHDGTFVQYAFINPIQAGQRNAKLRGQEMSWIEFSHLNESEKLRVRNQFRGGWKYGDVYADPEEFRVHMVLGEDGVYRWDTNNQVPPAEIIALLGLDEATVKLHDQYREADIQVAIQEYRQSQANRTPEQIARERAEARVAMGPGKTMVNIITGEKYTT